jgi:hypothetical protein
LVLSKSGRSPHGRPSCNTSPCAAPAAENDIPENLTQNVNSSAKIGRKARRLGCGKISTLFVPSQDIFNELNGNSCKGK